MNRIRPENLGEKWVMYIVKSISEVRWSTKYYPPMYIASAALFGYGAILTKSFFAMAFTMACLFYALIYFERWHFTRIIKRQQEQIDSLDKELKAIKLGK